MTEPFQDYQLHRELVTLWEGKQTGTLTAEVDGYTKTLYIKDGMVVFAATDDPNEKLTQILIGQGKFTQDQYDGVKDNFNEEVSIGRNLIEMGLITQQELAQGGKEQVYQVFSNVMHSERGTFAFEEEELPGGVVSLPPKYPDAFFRTILDFADKAWLSNQFGADLNFVAHRKEKAEPNFSQIEIGDFAPEIFNLIDGETDFNHMAFEVDVDDFLLLKFLYALQLLGYVEFKEPEDAPEEDPLPDLTGSEEEQAEAEEDDEPIPEPDADDVINELSEAMAESDELAQMGEVSMEETVQLPKSIVDDPNPGSMDVTMEISKDALADAAPGFLDEEEPEEDEEPDTASVFEDTGDGIAPFAEEPEEEFEEETEAGLDDLGVMSSQIFEQELSKMEEPEDEPEDKLQGVIMPDPEDEDDELGAEKEPKQPLSHEERRKRLLVLTTVLFFIFAGYLFINRPDMSFIAKYLPGGFEPPPDVESELAAMEADQEQQPAEEPAEDPPAEATTTAQTDPPKDAGAAEPEPTSDPVESAESSQPTETIAAKTTPQPATRTLARQPDPDKEFFSPIAEGWDPNTGRPSGENLSYAKAKVPKTPAGGANLSDVSRAPERTVTPPSETRPAPSTNTSDRPAAEPRQPVAGGNASALLTAGDYVGAAQVWAREKQGQRNRYTLALFLICEEQSVRNTIRDAGGSNLLYLLPKRYNGRDCYWACWGDYDTYRQATKAIAQLPEALLAERSRITVYSLRNLIP
ncbi:MAG: hypothetical protein QNK37_02845 [Acidobacteriota bacterium]|nr:hypothetical protein [Acidobacteriota bacterium]